MPARLPLTAALLATGAPLIAATALAAENLGQVLFEHAWVSGDERSVAGDGPGPHANDESCVACHFQGGVGGAGDRDHNVSTQGDLDNFFGGGQATMVPRFIQTMPTDGDPSPGVPLGFGSARNPPALFGAGLIDAVPAEVLHELAASPDPDFPEVTGRVSLTADGEVGRFAWKGHVTSLVDFVSQACEVELGLVVERPGLEGSVDAADLDAASVLALTEFVANLPAPPEADDDPAASRGEAVFAQVGCAACHVESVGPAERLFSDLLLHDMGPGLSDAGFGYAEVAPHELVAIAQEWRTPPLWGVADSAPYLHDGRADTLDQAIAHHGGEAAPATARWSALDAAERQDLSAFLRSLGGPEPR